MSSVEPADILIVDDTAANLQLLTQTLGERGHRVRAVTSGARALESAMAEPPDLILLDIRMPEISGFEVCRRLKGEARTREVPILFISALDELPDKVEAFAVGGVDYITKPFHVEEVLARTETHLALRRLNRRLEESNRRLARELNLAGRLQASFLPANLPSAEGWQLAARLQPARETSGDFYAVIPLPQEGLGLLVADVVDKGVAAALLMAMSWGLIWTYSSEHPTSPSRVFEAVNQSLVRHLGGTQFLTAFYGVLDPSTGGLSYVNAGQSPPLLVRASGAATERLGLSGPPIGVLDEARWQTRGVTIEAGDGLVCYTDGVTEAEGPAGEPFGEARLLRIVEASRRRSAVETCEAILDSVARHSGGDRLFDDVALLIATRAGPGEMERG